MRKRIITAAIALLFFAGAITTMHAWGFWAHKKINKYAVFTLPDPLKAFYEKHIDFVTEHSVDPDLRRNINKNEGNRHFLNADSYGKDPFGVLPQKWTDAVKKYSPDTLKAYGINPWYVDSLMTDLTKAFRDGKIEIALALSADIGHYIGDAHVPLHATKNYDGQLTHQKGIHGLWESRVPELVGDRYNFFAGHARYLTDPLAETWAILRESFSEKDSVLQIEKGLNDTFPKDKKYITVTKNDTIKYQVYSDQYTKRYSELLHGMVERKIRKSINAVGSFWYTAWVNAGKPAINDLDKIKLTDEQLNKIKEEELKWEHGK